MLAVYNPSCLAGEGTEPVRRVGVVCRYLSNSLSTAGSCTENEPVSFKK